MNPPSSPTQVLLPSDGTRLARYCWRADTPRAELVIVHGLGEHMGRYRGLVDLLNQMQITVHGADLPGHGRSAGTRGVPGKSADLLIELDALVQAVKNESGRPPILFGHSLGGLIAARYALDHAPDVRALALSSPALALRLSALQRGLLTVTHALAPDLGMPNQLDATMLSHDSAVIAAYRADPLVHQRISARLLRTMLAMMQTVAQRGARMAMPVCLQVGGSDRIVDPAGSRRLAEVIAPERLTLHWYDGAYHEIFNESPPYRARAQADLARWLTPFLAGS